ncbi:AMP-binding protein [Nocardia iowensis]|uniref:AMP-binding protein n=1 Tax=Nocardia iowensis TaxID=204891 RepID=UPI001FE6D73A|nr:class I adenylate-forming enzyme family protein [Nocardia iowensis]
MKNAGPEFFSSLTPSRGLPRLTRFSRKPATGKYGEAWSVAAARFPDQRIVLQRPADIAPEGGVEYTFSRWAGLVDEAAAALRAAGVRAWDRVAIMKANHPDVQVIGCAAAKLGAIPFQLAWNHGTEVAETLLRRLDRPFLVTDPGRLELAWPGGARAALAALTKSTVLIGGRGDGVVSYADLRGSAPAPTMLRDWTEPMVATHTSGTTGFPKFALHSAESMHALTHVETENWFLQGFRSSDVWAYLDPYFHQRTVTALMALATTGPKLVAISDIPDPGIAELFVAHKPTVVDMLPNIYLALEPMARDQPGLFENVRFYINSFDAIHTRTMRAFLAASKAPMPFWIQSWSQTENGVLVFRPYVRPMVRRVGKYPPPTQQLGWPLPTVAKVRAVDPHTGKQVPRGQVGLIEINQPGRCLDYVGESDRHRNKVDGWWWNTGDLGIISRWGSVRLVDREIDRIRGASGIAMEDVLLDRLPETSEVVVLARPNTLPVPVYSTYDGAAIAPDRWSAAAAGLPPLGEPIHLDWAKIPRTATWKVRRVELRHQLFGEPALGLGNWT